MKTTRTHACVGPGVLEVERGAGDLAEFCAELKAVGSVEAREVSTDRALEQLSLALPSDITRIESVSGAPP